MEEEVYAVAPDSSQRLQSDGGYRDAPFALAFLVHLLLVVFFGFTEGVPVLHSGGSGSGDGGGSEQAQYLGGLLLVCVISPIVCCIFAFTYVGYIKNNAESMVECLVTSHILITLAAVTSPRDSAANNRVEVPMYDTFDTSIKPDYTEEVGKQNTIRHLENRGHPSDEARRDFMAELSKDLTHHKDAHMQEVAAEATLLELALGQPFLLLF